MGEVDPLEPGKRISVYGGSPAPQQLAGAFNAMLDRIEADRRKSGRLVLSEEQNDRRELARDLHDAVGQDLTAIVLQLKRCAEHAPPDLGNELVAVQDTARAGLLDLDELVHRLRPQVLEDLGLANALTALAETFSQQSGLRIARELERDLPLLGPDAELVIYRVVQESLTNVARHADASMVELTLERHGNRLTLRVRDDGKGLSAARAGGEGIRGMRERAFLIGADLSFHRRPPSGLEVRLDLDGVPP